MNSEIRIADKYIGRDHAPFVIVEMSGNHNQSLERALEIVGAAATAGAHALKIQTYTPDTMTIDLDEREFHIGDPNSLWAGTSLYKLYGEAYTPWFPATRSPRSKTPISRLSAKWRRRASR